MATSRLDLAELNQGMPGITQVIGRALAEAAGVCFHSQQHTVGVIMQVSGVQTGSFEVYWPEPNEQTFRAWNDEQVATEHGACGVAVLLMENLIGYTVIERSAKGTGFDYWLGYQTDEIALTFDRKARLEVSGIRKGTEQEVSRWMRQKLQQTSASDEIDLPVYVAIVEFGSPRAEVQEK